MTTLNHIFNLFSTNFTIWNFPLFFYLYLHTTNLYSAFNRWPNFPSQFCKNKELYNITILTSLHHSTIHLYPKNILSIHKMKNHPMTTIQTFKVSSWIIYIMVQRKGDQKNIYPYTFKNIPRNMKNRRNWNFQPRISWL